MQLVPLSTKWLVVLQVMHDEFVDPLHVRQVGLHAVQMDKPAS